MTILSFQGYRRQCHRIQFTLLDGFVSSSDDQNTDELQPCMLTRRSKHPDASSCQRRHGMNCGFKSVMLRRVGTNVVVLAIAHFQGLPNIEQLRIAFGTGEDFRYIPIHEIVYALCSQMAKECCFFMHSLAATKHHTSPTVEINQHGRPGLHGQRSDSFITPVIVMYSNHS